VLTQIFVHTKNPDQEAQDLVSGRWSDFNQGRSEPAPQLKRDPISGYEYYQYITVEGKTLDAANLMLDAIIVGQLKPDEVKIDSSFRARLKSFLQKLDFRTDWSWN
jgi:hypothetical protein